MRWEERRDEERWSSTRTVTARPPWTSTIRTSLRKPSSRMCKATATSNSPPPLPDFSTLLVQGPYHSSAPIHLAYSALCDEEPQPPRPVLFFTPSRRQFATDLKSFCDDWVLNEAGKSNVIQKLDKATIMYNSFVTFLFELTICASFSFARFPPTPAHFSIAVSTLHVCPEAAPDIDSQRAWLNAKTTLPAPPRLIILHEISSYFVRSERQRPEQSDAHRYLYAFPRLRRR